MQMLPDLKRCIWRWDYPQHIFILSFSLIPYNYCENTLKAEDNYYLIPQILANSSSSSSHSAVSDTSTLLFSMAFFSISIDGDAYIRVVWVEVCPSIRDTSSSSTPFWYSPQALVLRSICGYSFCGSPGWSGLIFSAYLFSILSTFPVDIADRFPLITV